MKRFTVWFLIFVLLIPSAITAVADEINDVEQQISSIESKKNDISKQKQSEQNKKTTIQKEVTNISNAQNKTEREIKQTSEELKKVNQDIDVIDSAIIEAEDRYDKQMSAFKTRVRLMYENSSASPLETLIQSKSLGEFLSKLELMSLIAKRDKSLVQSLDTAKKDIEYKRKLKEDEKLAKQKQLNAQNNAKTALQVSRAQKEQEIGKINSILSQLEQKENELDKKSAEFANWLKSLKSKRKGGYSGNMTWPTPSCSIVTSPFGNRFHPVLKKYRMHTGIDIGASYGANIVAANKGTVILAGWQDGYGNTVIVDHGGNISTLYAHASRILVSVGDEVEAGAIIAKVGTTGLSTGPHLHFEVRKDGEPANPLDYVSP